MTTSWIARFADEPALIAPHMAGRFHHCLAALESGSNAELLATVRAEAGQGDEYWTELGPNRSKMLRPYVVENGILMIPVKGVLLHDFPYQFFGYATGYEYLAKARERGLADENVRAIAYIHDSPGGMVAGCFDEADRIFAARSVKPIRAYAAENSYSASYALSSAAETITVARTGGVGSVGVVTAHLDASKAMDEVGFKITFIHYGAHKVDGHPYGPLPEDVRNRIQARIDGLGELFVATVARNRNLDAAAVRATEALTFTAVEALENGLADMIGAPEEALAEFAAELTETDAGDETMSENKPAVTVASVKTDHPDVANALIQEGRDAAGADAEKATAAKVESALSADRERIATIQSLAEPGVSAIDTIISAGIKDGSSAGDVALKIAQSAEVKEDRKKADVLAGLSADDADAPDPAADADPDASSKPGPGATKEELVAHWNASPKGSDLRKNYVSAESYASSVLFDRKKGAA